MDPENRRDPERILQEIQREERRQRSGRLKIFLGYASGVGKSAKMLDEGRRRRQRGEDVVVAAIQPQSTAEIDRLLSVHEIIPTLKLSERDVIDIDKIVRRRPQIVLIDGLAYNNPPGSRHRYRWQEIDQLLQSGISVITSINLQYIDEMQDEVASITGKRPAETVPLAFLKLADDIEIIDAPALEQRSSRLREMALLVAAEVVESELRTYLEAQGIVENWGIQERILVGLTPRSDARPLLESGRRNADRFHGDLLVAYVRQDNLSPQDQAALDKNLDIARELGGTIHVLEGRDPARTLIDFARKEGVTQIFIGHSQRRDWWNRLRGNPVDRLIDLAEQIDVRVFPPKVRDVKKRGHLKVFLSYAAGAGKTYRMLEEAQALHARGADVVIGYFEPHDRKDTIAKTEGLDVVARRRMEYRGTMFEEMDTEAVIKRAPAVCVVDEFAHTNVPGSERSKRWEDVVRLLDAGIDVLTTMNLQHIESLNDQILQITGIRVRETVPDWVIKQADEVVMVDVTPEALINRLKRGVVYAPDKAAKALENFFREQSLAGLRELALRQAAHEVDVRHEPRSNDRLLIHITGEPSTAMLIRRGRRVADYLRAECFAIYISETGDLNGLPALEREAVERHLNFARNLHIETRILQGENAAAVLVDFAHRQRITQIFLMRPSARKLLRMGSLVSEILRLAQDMQITVVAERGGKARRD